MMAFVSRYMFSADRGTQANMSSCVVQASCDNVSNFMSEGVGQHDTKLNT